MKDRNSYFAEYQVLDNMPTELKKSLNNLMRWYDRRVISGTSLENLVNRINGDLVILINRHPFIIALLPAELEDVGKTDKKITLPEVGVLNLKRIKRS